MATAESDVLPFRITVLPEASVGGGGVALRFFFFFFGGVSGLQVEVAVLLPASA